MEQRTREILELLLEEKSFQTTAALAEKLNVSAKTVSRQLPKVEKILETSGLRLEKKSGVGIFIAGSDVKRYILSSKLKSKSKHEYTPNERRSIIIGKLLSSQEPIKLFALSSAVNVTDSTVSNDLDKLQSWFLTKHLKLLRKPGLGISVLGDERDFRRAIVSYIYENVSEERLLSLLQDNLPEQDDTPLVQVSKFLLDLIDADEFRRIEQMIRETEGVPNYKLSDNAFIGLIVHLALVVRRIKNHEEFSVDEETLSLLQASKEYISATTLAKKISDTFGIEVPESEICYITMHILGARSRYSSASLGNVSMMDNFRVVKMARQIMKRAAKITGRDIDKNKNLLAGLINHLTPTISRLKMHMDIRNPLLVEMQKHYPELLSLTQKCVVEVEEELGENLPESEIAYIAMHLGAALSDSEKFLHSVHRVVVACPTGMGTSRLLASKLRVNFPTLKIVDEVPILSLDAAYMATKDFEFVISTVPIPKLKCPVVVVGTALNDEDRKKIDSEIAEQNKKFLGSAFVPEVRPPFDEALIKMNAYGAAILELMSNYFFIHKNVSDIVGACELAGKLTSGDSQIQSEISKSLLLREDKGSTLIVGHHMVLLHCKSSFVKSTTFGILQFGEGFFYGEENVRTAIVLLAPIDADEYKIETIGHIASVLLDRWGFIEVLHEGNSDEIKNEMMNIFEEFYKSKYRETIGD